MSRNDVDYFTRRERAEREQAEKSLDAAARYAHLAMADGYAERLKSIVETPAIPLH